MHKVSLMGLSIRQTWALQHHQTGAQYSAMKWTKARVAVRSTVDPQLSLIASKAQSKMLTSCAVTLNVSET